MVAIFRQGDDSNDTESDQNDDGSPIYVDKLLGDINCINDIEVKVLIYIIINYFTHTQYWNSQKGKSIYKKHLLSFIQTRRFWRSCRVSYWLG